MANIVEFFVKIKDMASGPLQQLGKTGKNSFSELGQGIEKITGKFHLMTANITAMDNRLNDLRKTRAISFDGSQIRRINGEIDQLQAKKDRLEGGSRGGGFGMLRTGLAIAGIGSLAFLGKDIMGAGMEQQMNRTSLQALLGNQGGNIVNSQLLDFAKKSIYGNEVFNEGKIMAASGIKAQNITPVLKMIGDIGMGNKERMQSLALAFSETSTRGNLTGIQERMFLQGGLFNPLQQLHDMTHRSYAALQKDMREGKIGVNELVKAMEYATGPGGRYYHMMEKLQGQGAGKWTAFMGTMRTLAGTIGLTLMPALGAMADGLMWFVNNTGALYATGAAIGAMTAAWGAYSIAVNWAAIWTGALEVLAYWPLAVVGAVAGAIGYLCSSNDTYASSTENAADRTGSAIYKIKEWWGTLLYGLQDIWLRISDIYERFSKASAGLQMGNLHAVAEAITGDTDASKKRHLLSLARDNHFAMQALGLGDDGKKPTGLTPLMGFGNTKFDPTAGGSGSAPGEDTTKGITGGGIRNITINVAKFQDKTEIHAVSFKEGISETETMLKDMFLRIVGSAASQLN